MEVEAIKSTANGRSAIAKTAPRARRIWEVRGDNGEQYAEDRHEWVVCAYASRKLAIAHAEAAERFHKAFIANQRRRHNPFDRTGEASRMGSPAEYYAQAVPFRITLPTYSVKL
jgi:hypothetical protein